jgi:hypothetical protein
VQFQELWSYPTTGKIDDNWVLCLIFLYNMTFFVTSNRTLRSWCVNYIYEWSLGSVCFSSRQSLPGASKHLPGSDRCLVRMMPGRHWSKQLLTVSSPESSSTDLVCCYWFQFQFNLLLSCYSFKASLKDFRVSCWSWLVSLQSFWLHVTCKCMCFLHCSITFALKRGIGW